MVDPLALLPEYSSDRIDSRHRLVIIASQRAKHLMQGSKPRIPSKFTKESSIALEETLHGHVPFLVGAEARQAMKEVKRGRETALERKTSALTEEDSEEIKRELSVSIDDSSPSEESEGEEA